MKFKVTRERRIFKGRVFSVFDRDVVLPNGRTTRLTIVEHPGAVAIVPLFDNGDVLLIRQFRLAAKGEILEIPAGTREPGESARTTAAREIVEETGYRARRLVKVAEFFTAPGFCTEKMALFMAKGLTPAKGPRDHDEIIRPWRVPLARALHLVAQGRIRDAKSIAGLLLVTKYSQNFP
ncbi:MAG: NUDIX hydrolase [Planctomycetes bacterium]|nr:NUDIX hydrolase [Planctomycetota bacterium]